MKKQIIAVDVDDVLAASAEGWVAFSNERWGTRLTVNDYQENWALMWGVDHDTQARRAREIYDSDLVDRFRHDAQAVGVLRELAERFELVIATSRTPQVHELTLRWLDRHFAGIFSNVHLSGIYDDEAPGASSLTKAELIASIGADYLIDDQIKHCFAVAENGVQAVLFGDYSWNRGPELPSGVTRCNDWLAVAEYFREHR